MSNNKHVDRDVTETFMLSKMKRLNSLLQDGNEIFNELSVIFFFV